VDLRLAQGLVELALEGGMAGTVEGNWSLIAAEGVDNLL
jgi:hypothetical protein